MSKIYQREHLRVSDCFTINLSLIGTGHLLVSYSLSAIYDFMKASAILSFLQQNLIQRQQYTFAQT